VPKLTEIRADYRATADLKLDGPVPESDIPIRMYHLAPFGIDELRPLGSDITTRPWLLPQFSSKTETGTEVYDGELFIGLKSFRPPQNLSVLMVVKEGSEHPELKETPIHWSYLSNNRWKRLKPLQDYSDETLGLQKTGLITFQLPDDATSGDPLFDTEESLHWLKASVTRQASYFPAMIDIRAQAFPASFIDRGNSVTVLQDALPAGQISKFKQSRSDIKGFHSHGPLSKEWFRNMAIVFIPGSVRGFGTKIGGLQFMILNGLYWNTFPISGSPAV
jgi:hypothetical protein